MARTEKPSNPSSNESTPASKAADEGVDPTPHRGGQTTPHIQGEVSPRLPHEHDESADSQTAATPDPVIEQAHDDLAEGQQDTDRGPVMDQVYEGQVRPGATPQRGAPDKADDQPDGHAGPRR